MWKPRPRPLFPEPLHRAGLDNKTHHMGQLEPVCGRSPPEKDTSSQDESRGKKAETVALLLLSPERALKGTEIFAILCTSANDCESPVGMGLGITNKLKRVGKLATRNLQILKINCKSE